jgi:glycosyltransferase involved in cell wall biosynthesis
VHTLHIGGAEILAARLARRLQDHCRFVFACLEERGVLGDELQQEGFPVEVLTRRPGLDFRCAWRLGRFLRRERVDVLHAHQYTPFFYANAGRLPGIRPPILFTEHGREHPDYPRRKRILFNRLMLRRRDRVVAVGHAVRQALVANERIPDRRIEVVYNGIDAERFAGRLRDRAEVRRELGLGTAEPVIIQVARLDRLKDHSTALRCLARVTREALTARLILVGDGPEDAAIRTQVEQLGLAQSVLFLGLRKDVAQLLRAADLFLLSSVSEGIPLAVIEAMCAGLPVVSTEVGGTAEVVRDGHTGMLAAAGDDAALADAILRLHRDPDLRRRLGENGRLRARELFSEEQMARKYLGLYEQMWLSRLKGKACDEYAEGSQNLAAPSNLRPGRDTRPLGYVSAVSGELRMAAAPVASSDDLAVVAGSVRVSTPLGSCDQAAGADRFPARAAQDTGGPTRRMVLRFLGQAAPSERRG